MGAVVIVPGEYDTSEPTDALVLFYSLALVVRHPPRLHADALPSRCLWFLWRLAFPVNVHKMQWVRKLVAKPPRTSKLLESVAGLLQTLCRAGSVANEPHCRHMKAMPTSTLH